MAKHGVVVLSCLALVVIPTLRAQGGGPRFAVASVKKSAPAGSGPTMVLAGARRGSSWNATNATLRMIVRSAFGPQYQMQGLIVGGPDWADTDRFEVAAKIEGSASQTEVGAMVQAMLAERFHLETHTETRPLLILALVIARSDRRLGPEMRPTGVDCDALRESQRRGEAAPPSPPQPGEATPPCATGITFGNVTRIRSGGMTAGQLASALSQATGRPVFDRTGLSGDFIVQIEFARDPAVAPLGPQGALAAAPDAPSVFSAVEDQLGLKLEPRREPTKVLVIDRAEQPTPD